MAKNIISTRLIYVNDSSVILNHKQTRDKESAYSVIEFDKSIGITDICIPNPRIIYSYYDFPTTRYIGGATELLNLITNWLNKDYVVFVSYDTEKIKILDFYVIKLEQTLTKRKVKKMFHTPIAAIIQQHNNFKNVKTSVPIFETDEQALVSIVSLHGKHEYYITPSPINPTWLDGMYILNNELFRFTYYKKVVDYKLQ